MVAVKAMKKAMEKAASPAAPAMKKKAMKAVKKEVDEAVGGVAFSEEDVMAAVKRLMETTESRLESLQEWQSTHDSPPGTSPDSALARNSLAQIAQHPNYLEVCKYAMLREKFLADTLMWKRHVGAEPDATAVLFARETVVQLLVQATPSTPDVHVPVSLRLLQPPTPIEQRLATEIAGHL